MSDLENTVTGIEPEAVTTTDNAPENVPDNAAVQEEVVVSLDDKLAEIYRKGNPERGSDGKFSSATDDEQSDGGDAGIEGKPRSDAIETARTPSIEPPNSMPSELKAQWASVPPAMQQHHAQREAEAHRQITQLGQQVKAYEPFGRLVETNKDVFINSKRNVDPVSGISQLLEAQRQLDRDPYSSIVHIAKVYGVDLKAFSAQDGQSASNQSPVVASLQAQVQYLQEKLSTLEPVIVSREQRDVQERERTTLQAVESFLDENPVDDATATEIAHHIRVLNETSPDLPMREKMKAAYEKAKWSSPVLRDQLLSKEKAELEAKRAAEAAARVKEARRSSSVNVKSAPGSTKPVKDLDSELKEIYRQSSG